MTFWTALGTCYPKHNTRPPGAGNANTRHQRPGRPATLPWVQEAHGGARRQGLWQVDLDLDVCDQQKLLEANNAAVT